MGRSIDDIIESLPKARRDRIQARADKLAQDMLAGADSLAAIRKVAGLTQAELGELLGIKQNAVSQMEKRTDVYLSTIRNVAVALGYDLEVAFRTPDGKRLALPNFQPWNDPPARPAAAKSERGKASQRTGAGRRSHAEPSPAASARPKNAGRRTPGSR